MLKGHARAVGVAWAVLALLPLSALAQETGENPDVPPSQQVSATPDQPPARADDKPNPNPLEDARDRVYYPGDTERFKPLVLKLGGNVLLDQKAIWTSPFHMRRDDIKWWVGFGAATAALIATDKNDAVHPTLSTVSWSNHASNIGTA